MQVWLDKIEWASRGWKDLGVTVTVCAQWGGISQGHFSQSLPLCCRT